MRKVTACQTIAVESEELNNVVGAQLAAARAEAQAVRGDEYADAAGVAFDLPGQLFPLARKRDVTIERNLRNVAAISSSRNGWYER